jgi:uncharacterized protein
MSRFRILTLDGGGSWALIEAMTLIDLFGESATGHQVLSQFDMVAANSGGSIVLGGLLENMTLAQIRDVFLNEQRRKSVFVRKPLHLPGLEKYDTSGKLAGLRAAFPVRGDVRLQDAAADIPGYSSGKPVHLMIISFDYDRNRGVFFRSAPASRPGWGDGAVGIATVAEAVHASSNAPIRYFDRPAELFTQAGKRYWDGAISGGNNPVLMAVSEAIVLGVSPREIAALSLGTGTTVLPFLPDGAEPSPIFQTIHVSGLTTDLSKIAGAILDDPPDVATFMAHVMTGGPPDPAQLAGSSIVRMNPLIAPILNGNQFELPTGLDADAFESLVKLDLDAVDQDEVLEVENFAKLWLNGAVSNQPVRMGGDLTAEIGQARYSEAKAAWEDLIR